MPILVLRPLAAAAGGTPAATANKPTVVAEIAYATNPGASPTYTDVSTYLRAIGTSRGRNYEYDRAEAGTAGFTLSNRDSRFNPENTTGPYFPNLKPTRRCRLRATWLGSTYDLFVGYTKGYPQEFPEFGYDALVRQSASDGFYPLNMTKFRPGATALSAAVDTAPAPDTEEGIPVFSTALPMPQAPPFTVRVGLEDMLVVNVLGPTQYLVRRGQNQTPVTAHPELTAVTTLEVNYGPALSGTRIEQVLDHANVPASSRDIATGVSMMSASPDLAGQNILEHLLLIAEAENGQLFVSESGVITFRDRHWALQNERTDRAVLSDASYTGTAATAYGLGTFGSSLYGGGGALPYVLSGPVHHDEALISNVVRVTPNSGNTQTTSDQPSIDAHFERVLEKQWPLASDIDAKGASEWMLYNLKDAKLRIPSVTLNGAASPTTMWPVLLAMEIGQRYGFSYSPRGGGTPITRSVIVEGISHSADPSSHTVTVQFSPADTTTYWRLGTTGYSEMGETTRLSY